MEKALCPDGTKFSVVIGVDTATPLGQLLASVADKIQTHDGREMLHFWCSNVDATHPYYLEIVVHKLPTERPSRFRVPHNMVALIADPHLVDKMPFGFVPAQPKASSTG